MKPKKVNVLNLKSTGIGRWLPIFLWLSSSFGMISGMGNGTVSEEDNGLKVIPVLYDSTGVDGHLQSELAKTVYLSVEIMEKGLGGKVKPLFVDLGKKERGTQNILKIVHENNIVISLLESEQLVKFVKSYEKEEMSKKNILNVYTPRSLWKPQSVGGWSGVVVIKTLQMSEEAKAVALLHRVNKVGVKTLIPVLDSDNSKEQDYQLKYYAKLVGGRKGGFKLTKPIYLSRPEHEDNLRKVLGESVNFNEDHLRENFGNKSIMVGESNEEDLKPGILLLAKNGSKVAMAIAEERKHLLLNWFSPNIIELEEWAMKDKDNGQKDNRIEGARVEKANNSLFGLYTVNFVGAKGWDNPRRRQVLRELASFTESSPKILLSILTYDAVKLAMSHLKNEKLGNSLDGLSGKIEFDEKTGFRKGGTYLGSSLVPNGVSNRNNATLLQPSFWILEDVVTLKQLKKAVSLKSPPKITDYDVATSSILTKVELLKIVEGSGGAKCLKDHLMRIVVYDPFTQLPQRYFFSVENLPEVLVVPNHQGFGITFTCTGDGDEGVSTLSLACTPGVRMSQPINCFKSYVATGNKQTRNKRDAGGQKNGGQGHGHSVPSVQYQYGFASDPWNDGSSQYYYQGLKNRQDYQVPDYSGGPPRTDIPVEDDHTPPPPPPPPPSKLPELRQILKAAKPFVGSCIGSTTGCAMCVLVLGRLPLGTAPPACTGPCFVGTFGSCGSLLGRVFSETTVICTELFRQGLLDVETFVADAEFGKFMHNNSPYTMQGYTLLATPLVEQMKSSQTLTKIVAWFAIPWAHHMQYLLGRTNSTNWVGSGIHFVGYPICNLSGRFYTFYLNFRHVYLPNLIVPFILTIILLLILSPAIVATTRNLNRSGGGSRSRSFPTSLFSRCRKEGVEILNLNYFKAIGRRT